MDLRIISEHKYICGRAKEESRKGYNETLSFTYINSLSHFSSQFLHHHDHKCFFFPSPWLIGVQRTLSPLTALAKRR